MLLINASKHSPNQILIRFSGPAQHIEVAMALLGNASKTELVPGPQPSLVATVSPGLLDAIRSCQLLDKINGVPFVPLFVPDFS